MTRDRDPKIRAKMERAITVMTESVAETRDDGKATPLVGALLVKPSGDVDTASRGELREGDHAEFALLERKNRSTKLDGSTLFATLEPCSPGSRNPPKLSCAERIVLARIAEVWIGIEDPDPTVDRKGIKYLQDHGVKVQMFDRDLQEVIRSENREFIEQAEERAAATADEVVTRVVLSEFDDALALAETGEFDGEALRRFRTSAKIGDEVGSDAFNRRLVLLGVLEERDETLVPTGFGMILFGKEPRLHMPQAGMLGTVHFPEGEPEIRDFDGPAVLIPDQVMDWLRAKLPNPIDRSEAQRKEANEGLFLATREAIANALMHRDYDVEGTPCQLVASPEEIVVKSPGLPVEPITLEQLRRFDAPALSRNPRLRYVFAKMGLAEERGLGLPSIRSHASDSGLPVPEYSYEAPNVVLTVYRSAEAAVPEKLRAALSGLTESELAGWEWVATQEVVTTAQYEKARGVPNRTARNHLKKFEKLELLVRKGAGRGTRYRVLRE